VTKKCEWGLVPGEGGGKLNRSWGRKIGGTYKGAFEGSNSGLAK